VQSVYAGRTLVADILDSISLVTPEDVWFQSVSLGLPDPVATSKGGKPVSASDSVEPGSLSIQGDTYGFEGVARMLVRLQLIPTLAEVSLLSAGEPLGQVDSSLGVRGFTINAAVINDQPADTPLPVTQAEVVTP
jgi:hypothetical protein